MQTCSGTVCRKAADSHLVHIELHFFFLPCSPFASCRAHDLSGYLANMALIIAEEQGTTEVAHPAGTPPAALNGASPMEIVGEEGTSIRFCKLFLCPCSFLAREILICCRTRNDHTRQGQCWRNRGCRCQWERFGYGRCIGNCFCSHPLVVIGLFGSLCLPLVLRLVPKKKPSLKSSKVKLLLTVGLNLISWSSHAILQPKSVAFGTSFP